MAQLEMAEQYNINIDAGYGTVSRGWFNYKGFNQPEWDKHNQLSVCSFDVFSISLWDSIMVMLLGFISETH